MIAPMPTTGGLYEKALTHAAGIPNGVLVFGDTPPDATSRGAAYVIVDPDPGWERVARADGKVTEHNGQFVLRCCGSGVAQATHALDTARAHFRDWRPYTDPRYTAAIELSAGSIVVDRSVPTDLRYSYTLTYTVRD